jgi:hypothetical protein
MMVQVLEKFLPTIPFLAVLATSQFGDVTGRSGDQQIRVRPDCGGFQRWILFLFPG